MTQRFVHVEDQQRHVGQCRVIGNGQEFGFLLTKRQQRFRLVKIGFVVCLGFGKQRVEFGKFAV